MPTSKLAQETVKGGPIEAMPVVKANEDGYQATISNVPVGAALAGAGVDNPGGAVTPKQ